MELLFLLLILAVFLLPTLLMMRSQRKRQATALEMQASLQPGEKVVSISGIHGTIVSGTETTIDIEIAPGVVTTMERAGIMRRQEGNASTSIAGEQSMTHPKDSSVEDERPLD